MRSKNPDEVLDSDDVCYEGEPQECNDFIHGKRKPRYEKVFIDGGSNATDYK